jgi:hypothetical protein
MAWCATIPHQALRCALLSPCKAALHMDMNNPEPALAVSLYSKHVSRACAVLLPCMTSPLGTASRPVANMHTCWGRPAHWPQHKVPPGMQPTQQHSNLCDCGYTHNSTARVLTPSSISVLGTAAFRALRQHMMQLFWKHIPTAWCTVVGCGGSGTTTGPRSHRPQQKHVMYQVPSLYCTFLRPQTPRSLHCKNTIAQLLTRARAYRMQCKRSNPPIVLAALSRCKQCRHLPQPLLCTHTVEPPHYGQHTDCSLF